MTNTIYRMPNRVSLYKATTEGANWFFCLYIQQKQYRKSLKTSDLEEAKVAADKLYKELIEKHNNGKKIRYRHKESSRIRLKTAVVITLMAQQNNSCNICSTKLGTDNVPCIDHDHKTGAIRSLLCSPCNVVLGMAKENPQVLRRAAQYVEDYNHIGSN